MSHRDKGSGLEDSGARPLWLRPWSLATPKRQIVTSPLPCGCQIASCLYRGPLLGPIHFSKGRAETRLSWRVLPGKEMRTWGKGGKGLQVSAGEEVLQVSCREELLQGHQMSWSIEKTEGLSSKVRFCTGSTQEHSS